jgi:hypothetical protein
LFSPFSIWVDASGVKYFTDLHACTVRKIDGSGIISTIIGIAHDCGSNINTGSGLSVKLNKPYGITGDNARSLFIADSRNNVVRQYDTSSGDILFSFDGTSFTGDNSAFVFPTTVAFSSASGCLYLGENYKPAIKRITLLTSSAVSIATASLITDGPESGEDELLLNRVKSISVFGITGKGSTVDLLLISDALNHRVLTMFTVTDDGHEDGIAITDRRLLSSSSSFPDSFGNELSILKDLKSNDISSLLGAGVIFMLICAALRRRLSKMFSTEKHNLSSSENQQLLKSSFIEV